MSIGRKRLILTLIPPAAGPCWRCGPRYAMDFLLMGLILVTAVRLTRISFDKEHSPLWMCAALLSPAFLSYTPCSD